MATLDELKLALKQKAAETPSIPTRRLSDDEYDLGFKILKQGSTAYKEFIVPKLSQLVSSLLVSRIGISVLEIGPGPETILEHLPSYLRRRITKYVALEPNQVFAERLEASLKVDEDGQAPFSCLNTPSAVYRHEFSLEDRKWTDADAEKFDLVLFCHSMYRLTPKSKFIEHSLNALPRQAKGEMIIVFHRGMALNLDGLVCHQTAGFPTGSIRVADDDEMLDCFAPFIAGFAMQNPIMDGVVALGQRKTCRALAHRDTSNPDNLVFGSPEVMVAFTRHATALLELTQQVPVVTEAWKVKNREATIHRPAAVIRPTEIRHIQDCVRWALKHNVSLTVVGGGHSGHCQLPNVVAIDMSHFDQTVISTNQHPYEWSADDPIPLLVVGAGCKTGDVVQKAMKAGLTIPLGSRPSVGAGLWLQGGIGHLSRQYGHTCDAIVGIVMVSVDSGEVLCIGQFPSEHRPADAVCPENGQELLWAMKGAGNNFGIVVGVTFRTSSAPSYSVRNWIVSSNDREETAVKLKDIDDYAATLPGQCSIDAYLYWEAEKLCLGVNMFTVSPDVLEFQLFGGSFLREPSAFGAKVFSKDVDGVGLFETEMYMSSMHGGHGSGKTSSFKRCLFLESIGGIDVASILIAAIESRPSPFCYLHLLHAGGETSSTDPKASAFGCRDWQFACVLTGVWPRDQDGQAAARAAIQWVYDVAMKLLPLSNGAYAADLGGDPRDAPLAKTAFGTNLSRLACLKSRLDPCNVLAYACPLPKAAKKKLIFLVTGDSCAGKDYCANVWACELIQSGHTARVVSISDATKQEYAIATGVDLDRLLQDRAYKEEHRPALTSFFKAQIQDRPELPKEHFLSVVRSAKEADVIFLTGMRDEAPVATFSYLVADSKVIEVRVQANRETCSARGGSGETSDGDDSMPAREDASLPDIIFINDTSGAEKAKRFCADHLLPLLHNDFSQLADMVRCVPNFPTPGMNFRDILGIAQHAGGLALCTSLLQSCYVDKWAKIDKRAKVNAIACCESGGFVFASALALKIDKPLALIRKAGKLPPPTITTAKDASYISSSDLKDSSETYIEMARSTIPRGASVVVVDDVLSTGKTLCAVLSLLREGGTKVENIDVLVVAEFPVHRGRELLRQRGLGRVRVQSLLVFGGA